jgi:hypothetical protein
MLSASSRVLFSFPLNSVPFKLMVGSCSCLDHCERKSSFSHLVANPPQAGAWIWTRSKGSWLFQHAHMPICTTQVVVSQQWQKLKLAYQHFPWRLLVLLAPMESLPALIQSELAMALHGKGPLVSYHYCLRNGNTARKIHTLSATLIDPWTRSPNFLALAQDNYGTMVIIVGWQEAIQHYLDSRMTIKEAIVTSVLRRLQCPCLVLAICGLIH